MLPPNAPLACLSHGDLVRLVEARDVRIREMSARMEELGRRVAWFERQLFGSLSERRALQGADARQLFLDEMLEVPEEPPVPGMTIKSYERSQRRKPTEIMETDSRLNFGPGVPVQVIEVPNPELAGLGPDDYEVVDERCTFRLAQTPGAYVVLKYVRKVVKIKAVTEPVTDGAGHVQASEEGESRSEGGPVMFEATTSQDAVAEEVAQVGTRAGGPAPHLAVPRLSCPPVPPAIFERSFADVSFLAGTVVDKFLYHLPLYRQHQRLEQGGIFVHRGTLTRLVHRLAELLEPIHVAVLSSVLLGDFLTVDETPTKAGRENGKMRKGWFWGFHGVQGEVAFVFSPSRSSAILDDVLRDYNGGVLSDGYVGYESFTKARMGSIIRYQCWAHARRKFIEAEKFAPDKVNQVINWIQILYAVEEKARGCPERLLALRQRVSKPTMNKLFRFLEKDLSETAFLPSNPFVKAAAYAAQRKTELMACLDNPAVPLDTNHLEREFRPHAVGRKNWMFHVTEVGVRAAGIFCTLIRSCIKVQVDPTTYLVDILQRIETHPALDVHLLTPRLWKENFASAPLTSDLRPQR